ncbi:MAG: PKD domain-containing protein [Bacteroidota bacterium]
MERIYKTKNNLKLFFLSLIFGSATALSAQLAGTYTIDSGSITGGTNYASWIDFRNDITTNGISGSVVVDVITSQSGAQIQFTPIAGASTTSTITINGNGKYYACSVADGVFLMNGADYITFNNLVVRNTMNSTNAQGFRFWNGADYNAIKKCTIEFSNLTSTSTSGGAYIAFSTSATSRTITSSTNHGSYNTIDSNLMRTTNANSPGPTFGIAIQGSNSSYSSVAQNNTISNNSIQNFYYYAIRNYYTNGNQIIGNDISRSNATSYNCFSTLFGIYSYYSYSSSRVSLIDNNNLHDWPYVGASVSSAPTTVYAFYTYYCYGNSTLRFSLSNNNIENIVASTNLYLGYNFYNSFFDLIGNMANNNDVSVSTSSSYNFHGWYNGYTSASYKFNDNTIQNCDGGYYWYGIRNYYPQTPSGVQEINNNLIQNNKNSYYYTYRIYSYYAQYASSTYPINISGNIVKDNSSNYYYTYNLYTYYYGTYNITDNIIDNNTSGYYYMYDIYTYFYGNYNIQRNKITNNKNTTIGYHYSIYNYYNYNVNITDNLICNNSGYYNTYGIYAYSFNSGSYIANIRQNTIKIDGTNSNYSSHTGYGIYCYMYYHSQVNVQGNIVDIQGNYGAYPAYTYNSTPANIKWDRNSYYISSISYEYWYCPSGSARTFTDWKGLGFAGSNESFGNPLWNAPTSCDLRSNALMNQNNIPLDPLNNKDANQVARNTYKNDRGALENFLDIESLSSDFSPNANECSGYTVSPTITIKNNFVVPIKDFDLMVSVNGVIISAQTVTNAISVNSAGTVTFKPIKFSKTGIQTVKFFLANADDKPSNDTLTYTFNIKIAPGGGNVTLDTMASAPKAHFDITGKPDVTTNSQRISYNITPPSTLGYNNGDYLGGLNNTNKWSATVSARTLSGMALPSSMFNIVAPTSSSDLRIDFTPDLSLVDSSIIISMKIIDYIIVCDTTYQRLVFVAPQGVPDFKFPTLVCDKDEVFFENISTVSTGSLLSQWDFGQGPETDATSPAYIFPGPGTYNVKLTVITSPYGYETSITKVVQVNEIPTANFKPTNACEGVAIKLTNLTYIGSGTLSYVWDFGDGSPTSTAVNPTKLYSLPGGYSVTLTASGNGCKNIIKKNVYQFAKPKALFTHVSGSCENESFLFSNSSVISQGEFGNNWNFNDAGNMSTIKEPSYDFLTAGIKNVKLKVISDFGCVDTMVVPINVKASPKSDFTYPFTCSRTLTPFTNTTIIPSGESVKTTNWDFGDGFTSMVFSPFKQWFNVGLTDVKLSTELNNGCKDEVMQTVYVGVQPAVDFQFSDQCAGTDVQFTNRTDFTQGKITYDWDFGDTYKSNDGSPKHSYTVGVGTQSFTVKLKASIEGGCADSLIKIVNVNPLPTTCNFDLTRDYTTSLTAYKFTPTGGSTSGINYIWLTGDGNTLTSANAGLSYSFAAPGKYCVTMIAENSLGCECTQTKCVTLATDINAVNNIEQLISIYPNPTQGIFNVTVNGNMHESVTVYVYNAVGAIVKTVTVNSNSISIDLSELSNGIYVVKVLTDNKITTQNIVLNK